jgi:hypothetical protein
VGEGAYRLLAVVAHTDTRSPGRLDAAFLFSTFSI